MNCDVYRVCAYAGDTPRLMARIYVANGSNNSVLVTQASVSSIAYAVTDLTDGDVAAVSGALVVADAIFNTLQTGTIWTEDSTGFNFLHQLPANAIPEQEHRYEARYTMTLTDGTKKSWVYLIETN